MIGDVVSKKAASRTLSDRVSSHHTESHVRSGESEGKQGQGDTLVLQAETLSLHTNDEAQEGRFETLLVLTETPTQLLSHEVHRETQLIEGDNEGVTLAAHSDGEGSGNTELLPDDVHSHYSGSDCEDDSKRNNFLKTVAHRDTSSAPLEIRHYDSEHHGAGKCKKLLDSDATTEEDEGDDVCYLEAVAESKPPCDNRQMEDSLGYTSKPSKVSECNLQVIEPLLVSSQRMDREHQLIDTDKSLVSKTRIAKPWQEIQSSVSFKDGLLEEAFEPGMHGTANELHTSKDTHSLRQTPKSTLDIGVMSKYSPCMSTSRSRSRSIASVRAASLRASGLRAAARKASIGSGGNDTADEYNSNATIQLTPGMVECLLPLDKALEDVKCSRGPTGSISVSCESCMPGMKKSNPQICGVTQAKTQRHIDALSLDEAGREGDASHGEMQELKAHFRRPCGQKVRKLFCEVEELSDKIPASEPEQAVNDEERRDDAMIHALQMGKTGFGNAAGKTVEVNHALGRKDVGNLKQQGSLSSGFISESTNLSYIESQEPAEESQCNALKVVDKLVWLNGTGLFPDSGPNMVSQQSCMKGSGSAKGVQSLAHTAEIKNMQDKMHVYDWVDSQQDEAAVCLDIKEVSGPLKTQKRHRGKRQAGSQQDRVKGLQAKYRSDVTVRKETSKVGNERIQKIGKGSSLENRCCKGGEQLKPNKKSTKLLEHEASNGMRHSQVDDKKCLVSQPAIESSHKTLKDSLKASELGAETQMTIQATDKMTPDLATDEAPTERKEKEQNRIEMPKGINVKEMTLRKRGGLKDDFGQEGKGHRTRSKTTESTKTSQPKNTKQVKWASSFEEHCQCEFNKEGHTIDKQFVQRIPKARSAVQATTMAPGSSTDKLFRTRSISDNYTTRSRTKSRSTNQKQDTTLFSSKQPIAAASHILSEEVPGVRKDGLNKMKIPVIRQCSITNMGQQDVPNKVSGEFKELLNSSPVLMSIDGKEDLLVSGLTNRHNRKNNKRKIEIADGNLKKRPVTRQHSAMNMGQQDVINRVEENVESPSALVSINEREESRPMNRQIRKKYKRERKAVDGSLNKGPVTRRQSNMNMGQQEDINKFNGGYKADVNLSSSHVSIDRTDGTSLQRCKNNNHRKREAADGILMDLSEAHRMQTQKYMSQLKGKGSNIQNGLLNDVSCSPIVRRTRGRLYALGPTGTNMAFVKGQSDTYDSRGHVDLSCDGQTSRTKGHSLDQKNRAPHQKDGGTDGQLAVSFNQTATATNRSKVTRHDKKRKTRHDKRRKTARFKTSSAFTPTLEGGRRRKREPGCIHVLFSHGLHEDTIKHQKKILAKLGGRMALSAADCTHFVADSFVRTRNMLQCMAAGKAVVTSLWLESCGQACYFVAEKNCILQDAKKEKKMGFSMQSSLAAAQREPIFKGLKILISPNTAPKFEAMTAIIEAAGGQAMQVPSFSKMDTSSDDNVSFIIACAEDYELCLPFLHNGFKVYSTELILNGIVSQNLDFSRNQLFEEYRQHAHSSRREANLKV